MLRLFVLADPTVRNRSSTIITFEWMYRARESPVAAVDRQQ
jgi:hypothetical protein